LRLQIGEIVRFENILYPDECFPSLGGRKSQAQIHHRLARNQQIFRIRYVCIIRGAVTRVDTEIARPAINRDAILRAARQCPTLQTSERLSRSIAGRGRSADLLKGARSIGKGVIFSLGPRPGKIRVQCRGRGERTIQIQAARRRLGGICKIAAQRLTRVDDIDVVVLDVLTKAAAFSVTRRSKNWFFVPISYVVAFRLSSIEIMGFTHRLGSRSRPPT
jgi:hypothetical protein